MAPAANSQRNRELRRHRALEGYATKCTRCRRMVYMVPDEQGVAQCLDPVPPVYLLRNTSPLTTLPVQPVATRGLMAMVEHGATCNARSRNGKRKTKAKDNSYY